LTESVKTEIVRSESVRKPTLLSEVLRAFLPLFQANVGVAIALKMTRLVGSKFTECGYPLMYTDLIFETQLILQLILALNKLIFFHVTTFRRIVGLTLRSTYRNAFSVHL
jgi:hypothetical protein